MRRAQGKISDSPDTKRQAAEAQGQPVPRPAASSISRKTAAADRGQADLESGRPRSAAEAAGSADADEAPADGTDGDAAAEPWVGGHSLHPLPLGN